jgi:hypothetical protein
LTSLRIEVQSRGPAAEPESGLVEGERSLFFGVEHAEIEMAAMVRDGRPETRSLREDADEPAAGGFLGVVEALVAKRFDAGRVEFPPWKVQLGVPRFVPAHRPVVRFGGLAFRCIASEGVHCFPDNERRQPRPRSARGVVPHSHEPARC